MKNMQQFMQQAQAIQKRIEDTQTKLASMEMSGQSGGGLVKVTLSGKGEMRKINIDESLLKAEEKEVLEDLVIAAFNDAKSQVEKYFSQEMAAVTGGALPPGLKLPF